jgi:hypothetical protein
MSPWAARPYGPARHNVLVAQLFQVSSAELHGPHLLDEGNQLGDRGDILLFQEVLHMVLTIFNWIKVWDVARPIHTLLGKVAQPGSLDPLGGMAQCIILQKVYAATQSGCVHYSLCCFLEASRQATKPQSARKTTPNHNTGRVLHSFDGVAAVKPVAVLGPSHFAPGGHQGAFSSTEVKCS